MAFDGITVAALTAEFRASCVGGFLSKIVQPEADELLLTVKKDRGLIRLLLCANASLPLAYLTNENKPAPATAPNFCMFLRKYAGGGRIVDIRQPGLERAIEFTIEHRDELGDLQTYTLILELMGKHSNLIFRDAAGTILESIKHVPAHMSSVREVLPGRLYFLPQTVKKADPLSVSEEGFFDALAETKGPISRAAVDAFTGISPVMGEELCARAALAPEKTWTDLSDEEKKALYAVFSACMEEVRAGRFSPVLYRDERGPVEFSVLPLTIYHGAQRRDYSSVSALLTDYYREKEKSSRLRQRSADLRQITDTALSRAVRKLELQEKQMRDTEKKDKFRVYGEILTAYGYSLKGGESEALLPNHYEDGKEIRIPLDPTLSAVDNAKKYFAKYSKQKRTAEQLETQLEKTRLEVAHLESVSASLSTCETERDLAEIRRELSEAGIVKRQAAAGKVKKEKPGSPLHYRNAEGFDFYVGKNNYQNEEVSFRIAGPNDWWFHAKGLPGSHVIVRSDAKELPDEVFAQAGALAAYYSKARLAPKVEIDYTLRKNLKKTPGGPPGFVVYHTNYSLMAIPALGDLVLLSDEA